MCVPLLAQIIHINRVQWQYIYSCTCF